MGPSELGDFVRAVGLTGLLCLVGIYLLVVAIIGYFIPIKFLLPKEIPIRSRMSRAGLACLGIVLLYPGVYSAFLGSFVRYSRPTVPEHVAPPPEKTGGSGSLLRPPAGESIKMLADLPAGRSPTGWQEVADSFRVLQASVARSSLSVQEAEKACAQVESFGLTEKNFRRLKYTPFHGEMYVYVGDVHSPRRKPTDLYVFNGKNFNWPEAGKISESDFRERLRNLKVQPTHLATSGGSESVHFSYGEETYRISVTQIYHVLFGNDLVVVNICRVVSNPRQAGDFPLNQCSKIIPGHKGWGINLPFDYGWRPRGTARLMDVQQCPSLSERHARQEARSENHEL